MDDAEISSDPPETPTDLSNDNFTLLYFNPQKGTENFLRLCRLIMVLCNDLFRDILSHYIKPSDLRAELDKNKKKLMTIMNTDQKKKNLSNKWKHVPNFKRLGYFRNLHSSKKHLQHS